MRLLYIPAFSTSLYVSTVAHELRKVPAAKSLFGFLLATRGCYDARLGGTRYECGTQTWFLNAGCEYVVR